MKRSVMLAMALGAYEVCAETQLTIYNQNFATVKETRTLEVKKGENVMSVTDITAHLEPDSVVLRDLDDPNAMRILEQNYESDPLNEGLMLRKAEGQMIDFEVTMPQTGEKKIVQGRLIRSAYVPHTSAFSRYGSQYAYSQMAYASPASGGGQPIVEVDGKIMFGLPGRPQFKALGADAFLKPTLLWRLDAQRAGGRKVEFSYLTRGMKWESSYNLIAPEKGDEYSLTGWLMLENVSGKDFTNATVKLLAGDVNRINEEEARRRAMYGEVTTEQIRRQQPGVSERSFDEYHMYDVGRSLTLLDREIKQVEFVSAPKIPAGRAYVYDGAKIGERYRGYDAGSIRSQREYGTESNTKVWVMLETKNDKASGLGIPLPRGKVKIYRRDLDGRNEFIGEDLIDHTPKDEPLRMFLGNAFDLVGERKQTEFKMDNRGHDLDESFEITVRNHKAEPVEVRIVEHLYRWLQWEIKQSSQDFVKKDARTAEFIVKIPASGQAIVNYTAHYTW